MSVLARGGQAVPLLIKDLQEAYLHVANNAPWLGVSVEPKRSTARYSKRSGARTKMLGAAVKH